MCRSKRNLYYGLQMAIPMLFYVVALISPMFIRLLVDVSNLDYLSTALRLLILSGSMFWMIPKVIGIPEREGGSINLMRVGLLRVHVKSKDVMLGVLLGIISLGFMLIGSLIAGGYVFDLATLDLKHIFFSLVPGVFEEVVFRGFIMVVLIRHYKNYKKAVAFQIFLFTLSHVKDMSIWGALDVLTVAVIAVALTYVVLRTGHLYTAIIFHFIHDAFLFVVQKPEGIYEGTMENLVFYGSVWTGMMVVMLITKFLTEIKETGIYRREMLL